MWLFKRITNEKFATINRTTFYKTRSKTLQCRAYLYLPKIPENHAICMQRRMKSAWAKKCGTGRVCTNRIKSAIKEQNLTNGLHICKPRLEHFKTILNLSMVTSDISLIGLYKAGSKSNQKLILLFAFEPEDIDHYRNNSTIQNSILYYDRNCDITL